MSTATLQVPSPTAGPATPAEAAEALGQWAGLFKGLAEAPMVVDLQSDSLTLRANCEVLWRRHASLEVSNDRLRLHLKSGERSLWMQHFDVSALFRGAWCHVLLTPRPARERAWMLLASAAPAGELPNRDIWSSFIQVLETSGSRSGRRALATRLFRAIAEVTHDVDEQAVSDALSAASDSLAVLRILEQPNVVENLRASDPLGPARLRGVAARHELIEGAGGALSSQELAEALGLTRQAVDKRRRAGRLLALSFGRRGYRYPAFQVAKDGLLPGLESVLGALSGHDGWTQLAFFVAERSDLDGRTAVDLLKKGHQERVVRAAASLAEHGAA